MREIQDAIALAKKIAEDPAHGYDQLKRHGPDYDCSSLMNFIWDSVGVNVTAAGASFTGNMETAYIRCGFRKITRFDRASAADLLPGDVLLNTVHHTALYIGGGKIVEATINELGTVRGGATGDQTGKEIRIGQYYLYSKGWDMVLRYEENGQKEPENAPISADIWVPDSRISPLPVIKKGAPNTDSVLALQYLLLARGLPLPFYGADGEFGDETREAVMIFQRKTGLEVDGIVGPNTWNALVNYNGG